MKKFFVLGVVIVMTLFLLAACGGGSAGGDDSAGGGGTAAPATEAGDDPCPCCPDCIQEECECAECGDSDGCKCRLPGGPGGPYTFLVEIDTNFVGSLGQVYRTTGTATVTLDDFDSSGWFGSAEGYGVYSDWGKDYQELEEATDYDFTVRLSNFDPEKGDSIKVGADRFCTATGTGFLMLSFEILRTDLLDEETGLYTFELPMENGKAELTDHWKEPPPGLIVIDMTFTATQVD
ncbi:MAG: hypothetical protein FWG03_05540 [Clostridiales bacterium]|nr:hypothetical protein [Clostridiales bacterium]